MPEESHPYCAMEDRLEYARFHFEWMREQYEEAARWGFGVSCEFY